MSDQSAIDQSLPKRLWAKPSSHGFIQVFAIIVLALGMVVGTYLASQSQDIRSQAKGGPYPRTYEECITEGNTPSECRGFPRATPPPLTPSEQTQHDAIAGIVENLERGRTDLLSQPDCDAPCQSQLRLYTQSLEYYARIQTCVTPRVCEQIRNLAQQRLETTQLPTPTPPPPSPTPLVALITPTPPPPSPTPLVVPLTPTPTKKVEPTPKPPITKATDLTSSEQTQYDAIAGRVKNLERGRTDLLSQPDCDAACQSQLRLYTQSLEYYARIQTCVTPRVCEQIRKLAQQHLEATQKPTVLKLTPTPTKKVEPTPKPTQQPTPGVGGFASTVLTNVIDTLRRFIQSLGQLTRQGAPEPTSEEPATEIPTVEIPVVDLESFQSCKDSGLSDTECVLLTQKNTGFTPLTGGRTTPTPSRLPAQGTTPTPLPSEITQQVLPTVPPEIRPEPLLVPNPGQCGSCRGEGIGWCQADSVRCICRDGQVTQLPDPWCDTETGPVQRCAGRDQKDTTGANCGRPPGATCGDNTCSAPNENWETCPADCPYQDPNVAREAVPGSQRTVGQPETPPISPNFFATLADWVDRFFSLFGRVQPTATSCSPGTCIDGKICSADPIGRGFLTQTDCGSNNTCVLNTCVSGRRCIYDPLKGGTIIGNERCGRQPTPTPSPTIEPCGGDGTCPVGTMCTDVLSPSGERRSLCLSVSGSASPVFPGQ